MLLKQLPLHTRVKCEWVYVYLMEKPETRQPMNWLVNQQGLTTGKAKLRL